jgi:hypothetical protein
MSSSSSDINTEDLFDNPLVRAALASMSEEDKQKYKEIGEQMYGSMNFEDARYLIDPNVQMSQALNCLEGQIRSGLHPSDMDKNERKLLEDAYGSEWYKKWGFTKKDLKEIENTPTLSSDSS